MERFAPATLATTIFQAPGWVRVGITAPVQRIREQAAYELACAICDAGARHVRDDRAQLVVCIGSMIVKVVARCTKLARVQRLGLPTDSDIYNSFKRL